MKKTILFYLFFIFYLSFYVSASNNDNILKEKSHLVELEIDIAKKSSSEEEKTKRREKIFSNVEYKKSAIEYFKRIAIDAALSSSKSDVQRANNFIEKEDKFFFPAEILQIDIYQEIRCIFLTEYNNKLIELISQKNGIYEERSNKHLNFFELFNPHTNPDNNNFKIDPWL
jgi:hypothetical protein